MELLNNIILLVNNIMNIFKFFKILISIIFFLNISTINADENLIPLSKLIKQQNLKTEKGKLNYLSVFSIQCGSLFKAINEVIPNNNILLASSNLQEGALITRIMIQKKTEQRKIKKDTERKILIMSRQYLKLLEENHKMNGNYIEGSEIITNDQKMCKKFVPRFYRFLKNNNFTIKK